MRGAVRPVAMRRRTVAMLAATLLVGSACAGSDDGAVGSTRDLTAAEAVGAADPMSDAAPEAESDPAPEMAPAPPPPPPPPSLPPPPPLPPPEPGIERLVRTLPGVDWDPDQPISNARFQRFDSLRHDEVGQTLEVTEALELHRISVWFSAPSIGLPGFREIYYDGIDWGLVEQYVQNGVPVDDLGIALSIGLYRSPDPDAFPTIRRMTSSFGGSSVQRERDVIPLSAMVAVSDQRLVGRVRAGSGASLLDLTEPVVMEPGRWLVTLRINGDDGEVDVIDLGINGWESGRPPDIVIPSDYPPECLGYTPADDPTPGFGFLWRDTDRPDHFVPGFAKVRACAVTGRYDNPVGTGDIGLDLWGFPVG